MKARTVGIAALALAGALAPAAASAEIVLPAGFTARVYVTGEGFHTPAPADVRGIPATTTLAVDHAGALYLARTGRRYSGGEIDDPWPVYRIPPGGARLTPATEARYLYGPPLLSPHVSTGPGGQVLVTTFDWDRKVGALYRLRGARSELLAGGTPPAGGAPLLVQPEGVAVGPDRVYVADRARGVVVKLDPVGRVLDTEWVRVTRPRLLAAPVDGGLWVAGDGEAQAPWQRGPGELWRVSPEGERSLVLRGPVAAGMTLGPAGRLFVADRHAGRIFVIDAGGAPVEFARFTNGDAPRSLGFVPSTPETRAAGLAGDLFVVTIRRGAWPVNEVLRISGPFDAPARTPDPISAPQR